MNLMDKHTNDTPEIYDFIPDWTALFTADQAERELRNFLFRGVGLYLTKTDTIIVLPAIVSARAATPPVFRFCVYNNVSAHEAFNTIINLPVRTDTR